MAKLTDKDLLSNPASGDYLHLVDVSDTTDDPAGTSKKTTVQDIVDLVTVGAGGGDMLASNNLSDLTNAATGRTNLGVAIGSDVQAHSSVLDSTTASFTTADETKLDAIEANATADQTGAEIEALLDTELGSTDWKTGGGAPEGTAVLSTGETGGSKFLREDGDGTSSWQAITGGGDMLAANNLSDLTNDATARTNLGVAIGSDVQAYDANLPTWPATVDATEVGYLNGVTSAIQTQIDAKEATVTRTGSDTAVVTGTAGTADNLVKWDANGDAVDAGFGVTTGTPGKGSLLIGDGTAEYDEVVAGTNDQVIVYDSAQANGVKKVDLDSSIQFVIDGGGSAITTGIKGDIEVPFDCTIEQVTLLADQSGSIVVDIWNDTYANFPATDADSITASAVPTISTATKSQDSTLTGWTTALTQGDVLRFNVDSITTCERVTLSLRVRRNF